MTDRETPAGAVEALDAAVAGPPLRDPSGRPCSICGDDEPSHVHHEGRRIEDYFTVGRGESDFAAALRWHHRLLTRSVDVERWQRIETAARAYIEDIDANIAVWERNIESEVFDPERPRRSDAAEAALRDALGRSRERMATRRPWQPSDGTDAEGETA